MPVLSFVSKRPWSTRSTKSFGYCAWFYFTHIARNISRCSKDAHDIEPLGQGEISLP
jgi:hypothetical protein